MSIFNKKGIAKVNIKIVIAFIIGLLISGISVYAATVISSSEVSYTSNGQSTVKDAIDDLYSISSSWINPSYINFTSLDTNAKQTILASSSGVCIKRNNKVSCFKRNNWAVEKDHVQEVFSDVSCNVQSSYIHCNGSDFYGHVYSDGTVHALDRSDDSYCTVWGDGTMNCTKALGMKMNSAKKTMIATTAGLLFKRTNGSIYFLSANNYNYEKNHILEIFSDVGTWDESTEKGCELRYSYVYCRASDFACSVYSTGYTYCYDLSDSSLCTVNNDGNNTVNCN